MKNPTLLLYDNNGVVWHYRPGMTEVPSGLQGVIADAPDMYSGATVNPVTKEVIWIFNQGWQ